METPSEVLIVGAGPTGLVLAIYLTKLGVKVHIIDKTTEPGTTSRALALHARTLEFYHQIGFDQKIIQNGIVADEVRLWIKGKLTAKVPFKDIGKGISPYPYVLIIPQDAHEKLLIEYLSNLGVTVERNTELTDFTQDESGVSAQIKKGDGRIENRKYQYISGCDGARSKVRNVLNADFPGGTYAHTFYVADVEATGPAINGKINGTLDSDDFILIFPLLGTNKARVIGTIKQDPNKDEKLTWEDVRLAPIQQLKINVLKVNWFSTYHVHHRVTSHFQKDRAFLLGDAAHIHSPVGGQGMNTGIGDAINLAWKLASVIKQKAQPSLLKTYEIERAAFAKRLIATTDQAFRVVTSSTWFAQFIRTKVTALVLPIATRIEFVKRFMFRTVSQTVIHYHMSPLSQGDAGVSGGDRLPWIPLANGKDNFSVLTDLKWQIHIYGEPRQDLSKTCNEHQIKIHTFPWENSMSKAKVMRNAVYLVRPDGYIAICGTKVSPEDIEKYFTSIF